MPNNPIPQVWGEHISKVVKGIICRSCAQSLEQMEFSILMSWNDELRLLIAIVASPLTPENIDEYSPFPVSVDLASINEVLPSGSLREVHINLTSGIMVLEWLQPVSGELGADGPIVVVLQLGRVPSDEIDIDDIDENDIEAYRKACVPPQAWASDVSIHNSILSKDVFHSDSDLNELLIDSLTLAGVLAVERDVKDWSDEEKKDAAIWAANACTSNHVEGVTMSGLVPKVVSKLPRIS